MKFHYNQYLSQDIELIRETVSRYPLALITSRYHRQWYASHIPLFFSTHENSLFGHADAANPQFNNSDTDEVQAVFMGPNSFIPPEAYATKQLPTWNYIAVHVIGKMIITRDPIKNLETIRATIERLGYSANEILTSKSQSSIQHWLNTISSIRIEITHIEGRFKLSQDKASIDIEAAEQYFVERNSERIEKLFLSKLKKINESKNTLNEKKL